MGGVLSRLAVFWRANWSYPAAWPGPSAWLRREASVLADQCFEEEDPRQIEVVLNIAHGENVCSLRD